MCLAAPSKVIALHGATALTECFGQTREVSLLLMEDEDIAVGDYLLIQAGALPLNAWSPSAPWKPWPSWKNWSAPTLTTTRRWGAVA